MSRRKHATDHGSSTLEMVIGFPIVLTLVLLIVNTALWWHARDTAMAAAQEGVRTGRAYGAHASDGRTTALSFARTVGDGVLLAPAVSTRGSNAQTVVVRVSGLSVSLVPFLHLTVNQVARGPVERFTAPGNAP